MQSQFLAQLLLTFSASVLFLSASGARAQAPLPGSLQWRANLAKSQGQTRTEILQFEEAGDSTSTLAETITQSLFIDGVVESSAVSGAPDSEYVETWYKVKVLARGPEPRPREAYPSGPIPEQLGELRSDEILVVRLCGTAVVNGISISEHLERPLVESKRYLLFLDPLKHTGAYWTGLTPPVDVDGHGHLVRPAKETNFSRSVAKYRNVTELERDVRRMTQKHQER